MSPAWVTKETAETFLRMKEAQDRISAAAGVYSTALGSMIGVETIKAQMMTRLVG